MTEQVFLGKEHHSTASLGKVMWDRFPLYIKDYLQFSFFYFIAEGVRGHKVGATRQKNNLLFFF